MRGSGSYHWFLGYLHSKPSSWLIAIGCRDVKRLFTDYRLAFTDYRLADRLTEMGR